MMAALRRYLVAGLLVWVPLGVTLLIISWMVSFVDQTLLLLPEHWRPDYLLGGVHIPGLGVVLTLVVVIGTGIIMRHFFGFHLVGLGERVLARIPVVRGIYGAVKQVAETMFSNSGQSFHQVVLIRYPHRDCWTMGFLTGETAAEARRLTGRELMNVFVPTTPNPTSGFFLMVPREEIVELDMSVDEGLKMLLSLGVVQPKDKPDAAVSPASLS
jgi:uncharacterized membrane protein